MSPLAATFAYPGSGSRWPARPALRSRYLCMAWANGLRKHAGVEERCRTEDFETGELAVFPAGHGEGLQAFGRVN